MSFDETQIASAVQAGFEAANIADRVTFLCAVDLDGDPGIPVCLTKDDNGRSTVTVLKDVLAVKDERAPVPRRRTGVTHLHELDSFVAFVNRFKSDESAVYAEVSSFSVTAVINEHPEGPVAARWRDHRAVYKCPRSPEWIAWTSIDGKAMAQDAFADWIEARLEDLAVGDRGPAPTEVLRVARDLQVHTKGTFSRAIDPTTGTGHLVCKTENESASTPIPRAFFLSIPVFDGGQRYLVEARVRFAMVEGRPSFTVILHRRPEIERDAFMDVRVRVAQGCELPVFAGSPG